jgi:hypothetical protein
VIVLLATIARAAPPTATWAFDDSDGGFVHGGSPDLWQWGTPGAEPGSCVGWGSCWCTGLDSDYATDSYDTLTFASFDLEGIVGPRLKMAHWYDIHAGGDYGQLQVDDGSGNWTALGPTYGGDAFTGESSGWRTVYFDLSGVPDLGAVRVVLVSDGMINRPGWCIDDVQIFEGDVVPPLVEPSLVPSDTQDLDGPHEIVAEIVDDVGVASATVHWNDGVADHQSEMTPGPEDVWSFEFPPVPPGTTVRWSIVAEDEASNPTIWPEGDQASFRVYLAAPADLHAPDGRLVGTTVPLFWSEPISPHPVLAYRVYRDGMVLFPAVTDTSATVDMPTSESMFEVSAIFQTAVGEVEGDLSAPLLVSVSRPIVDPLVPDRGWPGDSLRIELTGTYLQLVGGDVFLDLGDGIAVGPANVTDVDRATFEVVIDPDAEAGARVATVVSGDLEIAVVGAFEILDGERPSLASVAPDSLRQGSHDTVVVTLDHVPAGKPAVYFGEGVVVESTTVDGPALTLEVTVLADAPLGERSIVVDDGQRILEGLSFTVRDQAARADRNCGTAPAGGIGSILAALALAFARRSARASKPH